MTHKGHNAFLMQQLIAEVDDCANGSIEAGKLKELAEWYMGILSPYLKGNPGHDPFCALQKDITLGCSCGYWRDDQGRPLRWKGMLRDDAAIIPSGKIAETVPPLDKPRHGARENTTAHQQGLNAAYKTYMDTAYRLAGLRRNADIMTLLEAAILEYRKHVP